MQGLSPPGHVTARSARGLSLTQPVTARTCSQSVENVVGAVQSIARPRNTGNQSIASLGSEIESSLFYDFLFCLFCFCFFVSILNLVIGEASLTLNLSTVVLLLLLCRLFCFVLFLVFVFVVVVFVFFKFFSSC